MRLIHQIPWSQAELEALMNILAANVFDGVKELAVEMEKQGSLCADGENKKRLRYFRELQSSGYPPLDATEIQRFKDVFEDANVRACYDALPFTEYNLAYLYGRIDDIGKDGYVPTDEDILRLRQRSTGCSETVFVAEKYRWTLLDMGGQRPERNKWEAAIKRGIHGLLFFSAVDEYNVASTEVTGKSKFEVSLDTFRGLFEGNMDLLEGAVVVVMMNKIDLLQSKLKADSEEFTKAFSDYSGAVTYEGSLQYYENLFRDALPPKFPDAMIAFHPCCGHDSGMIKEIFHSVRSSIVQQQMMASGI